MKKLIKEFNALDFHSNKLELSEELSWIYQQSYTIKNLWRDHYNYSMTDPRYLDADEATIYMDFLQFSMKALGSSGIFKLRDKKSLNYGIKTEEDLIKAMTKDCENIRMNKNNYVTPEYLKEYEEEKERLWKEYSQQKLMGKNERQIAEVMGDRFQRYADMSKLKYTDKLDKPYEQKQQI